MKTLVVYYSRTGTTRKLAETLAGALGADIEEIRERKDRRGPLGFLAALFGSFRRAASPIEPIDRDLRQYELVVVGTPVWAGSMAGPVRTFFRRHGGEIARAGLFCTMAGAKPGQALDHMAAACARRPAATLALREKLVKAGTGGDEVAAFVAALRSA